MERMGGMSQAHPYNPNCGCPGCQFLWAAEETYRRLGPPLKIGEFKPDQGDFAEDPRYRGFFRIWTGTYWHPCIIDAVGCVQDCAHHTQWGCLLDDSTLPTPPDINQCEAILARKAREATAQHRQQTDLPPMGRYVLIRYNGGNWHADDQDGVNWRVAAREPIDPRIGNNPLGWIWKEFGTASFSASEIDRWMELPHRSALPQEQA